VADPVLSGEDAEKHS